MAGSGNIVAVVYHTLPIPSEISRENARAKVFCGIIYFNQIKTIIKKRKKNPRSRLELAC